MKHTLLSPKFLFFFAFQILTYVLSNLETCRKMEGKRNQYQPWQVRNVEACSTTVQTILGFLRRVFISLSCCREQKGST